MLAELALYLSVAFLFLKGGNHHRSKVWCHSRTRLSAIRSPSSHSWSRGRFRAVYSCLLRMRGTVESLTNVSAYWLSNLVRCSGSRLRTVSREGFAYASSCNSCFNKTEIAFSCTQWALADHHIAHYCVTVASVLHLIWLHYIRAESMQAS